MGSVRGVPQAFPYQGSKRQLARQILACIPQGTRRLVEPFLGSGALTLAAAKLGRARRFWLNDNHAPLVELWRAILERPENLAAKYKALWDEQYGQERAYYDRVRDAFNKKHEPHLFLYLLARCVKAAIRYNGNGQFNNSPDNRRLGMRPSTMRLNVLQASALLSGKVRLTCLDYRDVLKRVRREDVVYMDPPYQGVCAARDNRYWGGVDYDSFVQCLADLNDRGVPFIVSYDGRTGTKVYGQLLPEHLFLHRLEIEVGPSTQATLLGRKEHTIESLYLSPALLERLGGSPPVFQQESALPLFGES